MSWESSEKRIFFSRIFTMKRQRRFQDMEEEIRAGLERFPDEIRFEVLLADAFWHQGKQSQAAGLLESLAGRAENLADYHTLLGNVNAGRKKFQEALEAFRLAASLKPSPFLIKRQADCLIGLKRFDEALALLKQLPAEERDVYVLGAMGRACEALNQGPEAQECYSEILRRQPDNQFARSRLVRLKLSHRGGKAEGEVQKMLRVPSRRDDPVLLKLRAEQLEAKRCFDEACQIYRELMEKDTPGNRESHRRNLAFTSYRGKMYDQAYPLLLELFEQNPADPYIRNTLVAAARRLGRTQEVIERFFSLARQSPAHRFLYGAARSLLKKESK